MYIDLISVLLPYDGHTHLGKLKDSTVTELISDHAKSSIAYNTCNVEVGSWRISILQNNLNGIALGPAWLLIIVTLSRREGQVSGC